MSTRLEKLGKLNFLGKIIEFRFKMTPGEVLVDFTKQQCEAFEKYRYLFSQHC
jgi:hypothetical protein